MRGAAPLIAPGWAWPCSAPGLCPSGRGWMSPGRCWGVRGREPKVKNSHGVWLLDVIFSPVWGHLRAISNSSGNSLLSFCTAMSAMGPRITTGRLKLAVGGQRYSGWVGARAELPAPEHPAPLLSVPTGLQLALLLPGEGGPSASAAGQPQDQCPQSGSGCPGAHLPSGPPSHMVDSAPAL